MAISHGSRLTVSTLPARRRFASPLRIAVPHVSTRMRPAGLVIALMLMGTLLGLVYLTQTIRASSASAEVVRLKAQLLELTQDRLSSGGAILSRTSSSVVIEWAERRGLQRLGQPIELKVDVP